ncbi:MAG: DUF3788 family protein [Victivallaceae bacterium]|nr:DUF3788 family protein [Victivallaceae bacterium]
MSRNVELEAVSRDTMRFMRGKYLLGEIGDGKNELKFKQGKRTVLTIYSHEDKYTFLIIFGRKEREKFELSREEFSKEIQNCYDAANIRHDGKWMSIDVTSVALLSDIKKLIAIKKRPNRKPFPKENALYSKCGQRCDLCVHYKGMNERFRQNIEPSLNRIYGGPDWSMRCGGCGRPDWYAEEESCSQLKCAYEKKLTACVDCDLYPCDHATVSDVLSRIHAKTILADDITRAILPFVPFQYENRI